MDLAFHLGATTADRLERAMTEREFVDWQRYAAKRMLPIRRIELYLAQIAHTVAQAGGMKRKGGGALALADFLFDRDDDAAAADDDYTVDDVAEFFGGDVIRVPKD